MDGVHEESRVQKNRCTSSSSSGESILALSSNMLWLCWTHTAKSHFPILAASLPPLCIQKHFGRKSIWTRRLPPWSQTERGMAKTFEVKLPTTTQSQGTHHLLDFSGDGNWEHDISWIYNNVNSVFSTFSSMTSLEWICKRFSWKLCVNMFKQKLPSYGSFPYYRGILKTRIRHWHTEVSHVTVIYINVTYESCARNFGSSFKACQLHGHRFTAPNGLS